MTGVIDLSALPSPDVIEDIDYEAELASMRNDLVALLPEDERAATEQVLARDSEPVTKLIQLFTYKLILAKQAFNDRAKGLLLAFAKGGDLDHIGTTYYLTPRLELSPATEDEPAIMERDDDYLRRLLLAQDGWSTAGSTRSYEYHALKASPDVLDAKPENAGGGVVRVTVLSRLGNGTASPTLLIAVDNALSAEEVRPLNDTVQVVGVTVRPYAIRAVITVPSGPAPEAVLTAARDSVAKYVARRTRLTYTNDLKVAGFGISRDAVLAALWLDQVEHVELLEPLADMPAIAGTACYCTGIEVTT